DLDGGHHRYRAAQHALRGLLEDHVLGTPRLVGHPVALLEIATGAERLVAGAGEDHGARVGITGERVEAGEQILAHGGVHRVVLLGAVEGDGDDVVVRRTGEEEVTIHGTYCSGAREAGLDRGWPVRDGSRLRSAFNRVTGRRP